jgi:hypothetical protein
LSGAHALDAEAVGAIAVRARWRLGDGKTLTIATNLGAEPVSAPLLSTTPLFGKTADHLPAMTTLAWLT